MLLDRSRIINHLERISVGGLIREAVVSGAFQCAAKEPGAEQIYVIAGALEGVEALPKEIGIANIELLINMLKSYSTAEVAVTFEESRIKLDSVSGVSYRLVVLQPGATPTRLEPAVVEIVQNLLPDKTWHALTPQMRDSITDSYKLLKPEQITFHVAEKFAVKIGQEIHDFATVSFGDNKNFAEQSEPFNLILNAKILNDVLKLIKDFEGTVFAVSEPTPTGSRVFGIRDGVYTYVLAPMSNG